MEYAAEYFTKGILTVLSGDWYIVPIFVLRIVTDWLREVKGELATGRICVSQPLLVLPAAPKHGGDEATEARR